MLAVAPGISGVRIQSCGGRRLLSRASRSATRPTGGISSSRGSVTRTAITSWRRLAARSARSFKLPIVAHPIFIMIVWVPCVLVGVWATTSLVPAKPPLPVEPNKILAFLVKTQADAVLGGFLAAGILAAIMSTMMLRKKVMPNQMRVYPQPMNQTAGMAEKEMRIS